MSLNRTKTDPELGRKIHDHLVECRVETPGVGQQHKFGGDRKAQIEYIESKFADIMTALGLDLFDDSLNETPKRVAKMLVGETMWGLDIEAFPKCTTVQNKMGYDEMIVEENVTVKSFCEHHFLPLMGHAYIAYFPKDKVLGLSKMPRVVEYFSRRPQIQERLTEQIFHALRYILDTDDIAVMIRAEHTCVSMRGVEDTDARTTTSKLGGRFRDIPTVRAEFLQIVSR